jgi:hypothetical protein
MTRQINEGMRTGDLEDLVLPMVSADEFVSKLDDNAIVFGLYVNDQQAASDLNRFIQKSPAPLLDTEVSPAPDQRGYFIVFFEVMNDDKIAETLGSILDEVSPLCKIEKWDMKIRLVKDLEPFDKDKISKHFKTIRDEVKRKETNESLLNFLQPSTLSNAEIRGNQLMIEGMGQNGVYDVVAFGPRSEVVSNQSWGVGPLDLEIADVLQELRMDRMLGEGWTATRMGGVTVVQRHDSDQAIVLKKR